jgi:hypothetical protein
MSEKKNNTKSTPSPPPHKYIFLTKMDNLVVTDCASYCHIYLACKSSSTEMDGWETQVSLVALVVGKRVKGGGGKVDTWLILCIFGKKKID